MVQAVAAAQESFYQWHIGNVIELGGFAVAIGSWWISRKTETRERREGQAKAAAEREDALITQTRMHTENTGMLKNLMEFHRAQIEINLKRNEEIAQLTTLAAASAEMVRGLDRRMQLMENWLLKRERG
jgi:hypothetical protein